MWSSAAVTLYTSSEHVEIGQNKKESRQVFFCVTRKILCVWTVSVGTFQVPWTSVRIVGTRSQWSVKHLASVPKYEVLSSKPVVGTVRQLLAGILVESFVTYTSRGKVARCEYYANRDEAVHTETRCIPGYRRACRGGRGLQSGSPPTKSKKKKNTEFLQTRWYETFYVI